MGSIVSAVAGPVLGYMGAKKQASATENAARMQADAAREAAEMSRFRPVGITTGFGSSQFATDAEGNVTGASYQLTPELQAIRDRLMLQAGAYDPTQIAQQAQALGGGAQSLFGAAQGYLSESPEIARQRFISQQQGLLAPINEQNLAGIRNRLFQTGRTGLATGGTSAGGLQATNPEMAAYYNALAQQQAQLAAGADQAAQQQQAFGAGLFGSGAGLLGQQTALTSGAYAPLQTQLGLAGTTEALGQQGLELGSALGGRAATAGAAAGDLLAAGGINAGRTMAGITDPTAALLGSFGRRITPTQTPSSNWFDTVLNTNSTASPFFNTGADVFSPSYMGGTSYGE
jgi:type II secretory pathway pseudopilin PulG